jgi:hypothetical protein
MESHRCGALAISLGSVRRPHALHPKSLLEPRPFDPSLLRVPGVQLDWSMQVPNQHLGAIGLRAVDTRYVNRRPLLSAQRNQQSVYIRSSVEMHAKSPYTSPEPRPRVCALPETIAKIFRHPPFSKLNEAHRGCRTLHVAELFSNTRLKTTRCPNRTLVRGRQQGWVRRGVREPVYRRTISSEGDGIKHGKCSATGRQRNSPSLPAPRWVDMQFFSPLTQPSGSTIAPGRSENGHALANTWI